jgi:hypothetical protein
LNELTLGGFAVASEVSQLALLGGSEPLAIIGGHFGLRCLTGFDLLGETNFVVLRQQRVLTDIGQIQADEIFFVTIDSVICSLAIARFGETDTYC